MKKKLLSLFFLLLLPLIFVFPSFAQTATSYQKTVVLPKDAVVNEDYFAAGNTVTVLGTVNGDAYVAGGTVVIDGTINGDLLVAGGNVTIRGNVTQDIRAAGGNIIISSKIGKNITVAGGSIHLADTALVRGSAVITGGTIDIASPVEKNITVGGGDVTIGNSVGGRIQAGVGQLTFLPTAVIQGNVTYFSENPALIEKGASLSGTLSYHNPPKPAENQKRAVRTLISGFDAALKLINLLLVTILGLLFLWLFPNFSSETEKMLRTKFGMSLLIGFAAVILIPFLCLILFITIFGIPFSLLLLLGFFIMLLLAKIIVAYTIGMLIATYAKFELHSLLLFIIGLLAYTLLSWIPILGVLVSILATLSGTGALLMQKRNTYLLLRAKKLL